MWDRTQSLRCQVTAGRRVPRGKALECSLPTCGLSGLRSTFPHGITGGDREAGTAAWRRHSSQRSSRLPPNRLRSKKVQEPLNSCASGLSVAAHSRKEGEGTRGRKVAGHDLLIPWPAGGRAGRAKPRSEKPAPSGLDAGRPEEAPPGPARHTACCLVPRCRAA